MNPTQFWQFGKSNEFETILKITVPSNYTFNWASVYGSVKYYDWGDGTTSTTKSHTFIDSGTYTIKIVGPIISFKVTESNLNIPIEIVKVSKSITNFQSTFYNCTGLTSIPSGLFDNNVSLIDFRYTFYNCTNLQSIPSGLFDNNVNIITFEYAFYNCTGLQTIPVGLFDKNKKANIFQGTFNNCTSLTNRPKPNGLELWQLAGTTGYPASISVNACFRNCTSMSDYSSLPIYVK